MLVGEKKTLGRVPPSGKQIRVYLLFSKKKKKNTIRRRTYLVSMFQIQIFIFTRKQAIITSRLI